MDTLITDYRAVFAKAFADGDTEKTRQDVADLRKRAAAARQSVELLEKFAYGAGTATNTAIRQLGAELARNPGNKAEIFNRARTIVADDLARDAAAMGVTL